MPQKRTCTGTTRKGTPCKANPLKNHNVCLAHADEQTRHSVGFRPDNGKGGRPKNPRAVDILREKLEADIDTVLAPLWDALAANQGIALAVKGGGMTIAELPDHGTRLKAARELLDRAYGRPKQTQEISGPEGAPVELMEIPVDQTERSKRAAALLAQHGHTDR